VLDIQSKSEVVLNTIKENDFHGASEAWKKLWDHCIHFLGDYFDGESSRT
jgi:hypothetical protein